MPYKKYNVFISYSHEDGKLFSENLVDRVRKHPGCAHISFWKDNYDLGSGNWSRHIEQAIEAVEFLVIIITPKALKSSNCRDEWMYARKKGVCILPVNGSPNEISYDSEFPNWLKKQHIYNLEEQWERFINDLNTKPHAEPIPFMAPRLTVVTDYVARVTELSRIKNYILRPGSGSMINKIICLQGSGGFGKTTLAIALCNDDDIINFFDDGILWVTLGQQAGSARDALRKLYRGLSKEEPSFIDVEEAQQKFREKIEKRNCLVVIDDVWKVQDLKQITSSVGNSFVLFTTRSVHILPQQGVTTVEISEMRTLESIALLTGKFRTDLQNTKAFEKFAGLLGHWPLLIKLAGAQIAKRIFEGSTPEQSLAYIQKKYERKGITGFDNEDATQRNGSVKKCLEASIDLLNSDEKGKLLQLGIFPDDELIPYDLISILWEVDDFDTEELLDKFHQIALLDLDFSNKNCSIHDVLLHYYNEQLGGTATTRLHNKLLESLGDFNNFKNQYNWKWYIWHLVQAGQGETAVNLLKNFNWIEAKLFATSIIELLKDYELLLLDVDTDLIHRALKLSAHILVEDKNQMPAQLLGRLGYFENEAIVQLLIKAKGWKKEMWLRSVRPSLAPPGSLTRILKGHTGGIRVLFASESEIISSSNDGTIRVWEIASGQCLRILKGHTGGIGSFFIDENKIISGAEDSTIRIWHKESGECLLTLAGHTGAITSLLILGDKIISGSEDSTIRIWHKHSGLCLMELRGHTAKISSLLIGDSKIISGSDDSTIRVWEAETGRCLQTLQGHTFWIRSVIFAAGKIISGSWDKTICIWDIVSGKCVQKLKGHTSWINLLLFYEGKIFSGSEDNTVRIWDMGSGQCLQTLQGHSGGIISLWIDNNKIISGSYDSSIRIWEMVSGKCLQILEGHSGGIGSLLVQDGKIISGSLDSTIRTWEIARGQWLQPMPGNAGIIGSLLVLEDKVINGSEDCKIRIWDATSGQCIHTLHGHAGAVDSLLVVNDKIVSGSEDRTIRIWEIASGRCLQTFEGHSGGIRALRVHADKLISSSWDSNIRIWEMATGHCLKILQGYAGGIRSLLFHDGKIISASYNRTIRVWEIRSGRCVQTLEGHVGAIRLLLIYCGKVFSGSEDSTIRIWDIESGECLGILQGHTKGIRSLLIYDNELISGSDDKDIRIWSISSGQCLQTLQAHKRRVSILVGYENKIISGSDDGTICIWDKSSGRCLQTLRAHTAEIRSLVINENILVSTDSLGLLIVHSLDEFNQLCRYYSDAEYTSQVVFDGKKIISGDRSGQLHILEIIKV